ncbi:SSI family serine proteinase inhibitor [Aquipuribacter hungaricus]
MTRTGPRTTHRWTTTVGVALLPLVLLLGGCGQGTGTAAPGGPATAAASGDPTTAPGGDGMDSTDGTGSTDGTDSTGPAQEPDGTTVPTGEVAPLPVPSGLPGGAPLPPDPAGADLTLVVGPPGAQQPPVTLVCDWTAGAASGTHPQAAQACADLRAAVTAGDPFAPVAPDAMCTQQYGGDAVVEVTGAVLAADGAPVDVAAVYTLTDGCETRRFTAMGAVLAPYRGSV